jgi:hypothetical protein
VLELALQDLLQQLTAVAACSLTETAAALLALLAVLLLSIHELHQHTAAAAAGCAALPLHWHLAVRGPFLSHARLKSNLPYQGPRAAPHPLMKDMAQKALH